MSSIKKGLVLSILFLACAKLSGTEAPDIAKIVASLSPNLHEMSPETYAFYQEKIKILKIPLDQLPDNYTKGLKLYYGLGVPEDYAASYTYFSKAFNSNKRKYSNALAFVGLIKLHKIFSTSGNVQDKIDDVFTNLNNSWKLGSYYGLSHILLLAMDFYNDPLFKKFKEVLDDPAIQTRIKQDANPTNPDGGQPDLQYVLSYACFACNKCKQLQLTEEMVWQCIEALVNKYRHIPALTLIAGHSLFDERKEHKELAIKAARSANSLNLPLGHYYYGLAICSRLVEDEAFNKGIELIKKSIEDGLPYGYHILGELALQGLDDNGVAGEVDYAKAFDYFKQGSEKWDIFSEYNLANMYFKGLGTEQDKDKGEALLKKIFSKTKYCDTQLNSVKGLIYQHGIGNYEQDLEKAKEFYQKAGISSEVKRLIKNVDLEIVEKARETREKALAGLLVEEVSKKKTKPKKEEQKKEEAAPEKHGESASVAEEIDIAGQKIASVLNTITYSDGSIITAVDTQNKVFTISNPVDASKVIIELEKMPVITDRKFKELQKFIYEKRVQDQFKERDRLLEQKAALPETVVRHTFAERVDQIVQLYGKKYYFKTDKGTIKNYALFGKIILADGTEYEGTFEYAFTDNTEISVYHRFLHPRSRIQTSYPRA